MKKNEVHDSIHSELTELHASANAIQEAFVRADLSSVNRLRLFFALCDANNELLRLLDLVASSDRTIPTEPTARTRRHVVPDPAFFGTATLSPARK